MKPETIKVKIVKISTGSWYRKIGDVYKVLKEPSTKYNFNNILAYKIHPDNGMLILAKNCEIFNEYPTLIPNYKK